VRKKILVLEDDPGQAEWIVELIGREFPDADLKLLESESEFVRFVQMEISQWQPDCALLDVLTHYYSIEDLEREPEISFDNLQPFDEAGLRCAGLLQQHVPGCRITLMTVMDQSPSQFPILQKGADGFKSNVLTFLANSSG
jgi:CheY-like chemotaxis protein